MTASFLKLARDLTAQALYRIGATLPSNARRFTIVTFHRVLRPEQLESYPLPGIAVTPDELGFLLRLFRDHFECGALEPLHRRWVAQEEFARPPLAITFDDAQLDNFENARPVLDREKVRASFFAPTEAIESGRLLWHDRAAYAVRALSLSDERATLAHAHSLGVTGSPAREELPSAIVGALKRETVEARERRIAEIDAEVGRPTAPTWDGMMTFEQLKQLAAEEHEIGSHSHSHPILTAIDAQALKHELETSRSMLERRLGTPIQSLCYPNGDADARVVRAARAAGYQRAVTTRWGWNPRGADPFLLTRCDMTSSGSRNAVGRLSRAQVTFRISGLYPGLG